MLDVLSLGSIGLYLGSLRSSSTAPAAAAAALVAPAILRAWCMGSACRSSLQVVGQRQLQSACSKATPAEPRLLSLWLCIIPIVMPCSYHPHMYLALPREPGVSVYDSVANVSSSDPVCPGRTRRRYRTNSSVSIPTELARWASAAFRALAR